jgi:hypothetical protein
LKEGGETSAAVFATRQGYALTVAKSIEKGVSAKCLPDSNAAIRPLGDSRYGELHAGKLRLQKAYKIPSGHSYEFLEDQDWNLQGFKNNSF